MWTMTCRVLASVVTFLIGWAVFAIASPSEEIRLPERAAPQILSITLRRQGCSDAERTCPVYDATYRSDGTCTYVGYANDDFIGKYEGEYNPQDFTDLVEQINKQGFFELPLVFPTSPVTETTSVEVVTSEGTRLVTTYNWASTPSGLRSLQALIEEQAYAADYWEKAP
jgi:hypothetical protein